MLPMDNCPRAKKTLNPSGTELPRADLSLPQPTADFTAPKSARFVSIQDSCHNSNFEHLIYLNAGHVSFSSAQVHFVLSMSIQINNYQLLYGL